MSALRTALNKTIAVLGLVAVLLGALEHEDLILQISNPPSDVSLKDEQAAGVGVCFVSCHLADMTHDSGTEGTFRSEVHRYWLAPVADTCVAPRIRARLLHGWPTVA